MEGFARILLDDFTAGIGAEGERYATRIVAAAKRMERLIDDLLAFTRVQRADVALQTVDPGRAVRRAINEVRSAAIDPGQVSIDITTPLPLVSADRIILAQVLGNLVANAAKFGAADTALHVIIRAERRSGRVRIWVEDDGSVSPASIRRASSMSSNAFMGRRRTPAPELAFAAPLGLQNP